jgi:hypothetical protein
MKTHTLQKVLTVIGTLSLLVSAPLRADDWAEKSFEVTGGGAMTVAYPVSWGKKPSYERGESITDLNFGPYGPKAKPIFLVHLQAVVATDPIQEASLEEVAKQEVENFRTTAFETDIPISRFEGETNFGFYFSITDSKPKRGEFDYLTMAVVAADHLLVKIYFLSSDGAPDFGSDAMQMMRSINYTPPEIEVEK